MLKRMISLLLSLVMTVSLLPTQAFATETITEPTEQAMETEATEETTAPTEVETESTEGTTAPMEEATEPTEASAVSTEAETEHAEVMTDLAEETVVANGTCGDNLTWKLDGDGTLTLSGVGEMVDFKYTTDTPWYSYRDDIVEIVFEEGITSIGGKMFDYGSNLSCISIPNSIIHIGEYFAHGCSNLIEVTIPESVSSIEKLAFTNCENLKEITVSSENPYFTSCDGVLFNKNMTELILYPGGKEGAYFIPDSVTSINAYAFAWCNNLTEVSIPNSVTSVGDQAFMNSGLTSVTLPNSLYRVNTFAFADCYNMTEITIPDSVKEIKISAFAYCTGLTDVYFSGTEEEWALITIGAANQWLTDAEIHFIQDHIHSYTSQVTASTCMEKGYTTYTCSCGDSYMDDYVDALGHDYQQVVCSRCDEIDLDAQYIANGTCGNNLKWKLYVSGTLVISGTGEMYSFNYYRNGEFVRAPWYNDRGLIERVYICKGVTSIGGFAFIDCKYLSNVRIPESVFSIGNFAFYGCGQLTSVTIPEGVTSIGSCSFEDCSSLTNLTISKCVNNIGSSAFASCRHLTSVTIPGGITMLGDGAFEGCTELTSVTILEGVTSIEARVFRDCSKLTSVVIPSSVISIGDSAFEGCSSLTNVTILEGATNIGASAFEGCSNLASVVIPNSVISVEDDAFDGCNSLTDIYITDISSWIRMAYANNYSNPMLCNLNEKKLYLNEMLITDLVIPEGVTSIGSYKFYNCKSLKSVTIPESVTNIKRSAFSNCSSLSSVTIPDSIDSLEQSAFSNCISLISVTIPENITSIERSTFYNCNSMTSVTIPNGITNIAEYAFYGCSSLADVYYGGTEVSWNKITLGDNNSNLQRAKIHYTYNDSGDDVITEGTCTETVFWKIINDRLIISGEGVIPDYVGVGTSGDLAPWYQYRSEIREIVIEKGITAIGSNAFSGCFELKTVVIPDGVTTIASNAFSFNNNLRAIEIPASMASIDYGAFFYCFHIEDIYFTGSEEEWNAIEIDEGNFEYSEGVTIHFNSRLPENAADSYPDEPNSPGEGADEPNIPEGNPDGSEKDNIVTHVRYLQVWENESCSALYGGDDYKTHYILSKDTDFTFLYNLDDYLGKFVLVTTQIQDDPDAENDILLSMIPVETRYGKVTDVEMNEEYSATIDGQIHPVSDSVKLSIYYIGKNMVYHIFNGKIVGLDHFDVVQGKICHWNHGVIQFANKYSPDNIDSYILFDNVSNDAKDFLGEYGSKEINAEIDCLDGLAFQFRKWDADSYYENLKQQAELQKEKDKVNKWNAISTKYNLWKAAVTDYIDTVNSTLGKYPAIKKESKEKAIKDEANNLKKYDASAKKNNTFIIQPSLIEGYEDEVYAALANFFLDGMCTELPNFSSLDYSSPADFADDVTKEIVNNISFWETKSFVDGNVTITICGTTGIFSNKQGMISIYDGGILKTTTAFSTPHDGVKKMTQFFLKELEDLAVDVSWNVATAVCDDLLKPLTGGSLSSLTEDTVKNTMKEIGEKCKLNSFIYDEMAALLKKLGVSHMKEALTLCASVKKEVDLAMGAVGDIDKLISYYNHIAFDEFIEADLLEETDKAAVKIAVSMLKGRTDDLKVAFLDYFESVTLPKKRYNKFTNQCPTTIAVYNSSGEQIGYVSEDELWHTETIEIRRAGDVKEIISLTDDDISFVITATEYGTMSCSMEEYDENSVPIGRLNYYEIALEPNQTFNAAISDHLDEEANSLAIVSDGEAIYANKYVPLNNGAYVEICCEQETNSGDIGGSVTGAGSYVRGDAVFLIAKPDEGFDFAGWFDGDTMVNEELIYHFTAISDRSLTAKYTKDYTISLDLQENSGGITLGEGKYLPGDIVNISAIPYKGYAFSGWYVGDELLSEESSYSIEISTSITINARFEPHEHSYDESRFMWQEDNTCTTVFLCTSCNMEKILNCTISSTITPEADDVDKVVLLAAVDFNGQTYTDTKTIFVPADGHVHTEVIDPVVVPTCTESGLSEGSHCSVCHNVLVQQTIIPAVDHKYVNKVCEFCGSIGGICGANAEWEIDESDHTLTVFGTGAMYDYLEPRSAPWYSYWNQITSVVISEGVTQIGAGAFTDFRALENVSVPDSVKIIGSNAFYGCIKLSGINIPASVKQIDHGAFDFCQSLTEFAVDESNEVYADKDGVLYSKDMCVLVKYPEGKTEPACFVVPESVNTIERTAMSNTRLTDIILHDDVSTLEYGAFSNSTISGIRIPEKVTEIAALLFQTTNLTSITLHENIESIGAGAFGVCDKLSEIVFEGSAPTFASSAFRDVTATAYYPVNDPTWTESVMQDYGGNITWVPVGAVQNRITVDTAELEGQPTIWIDGKEYAVQRIGDVSYVDLPNSDAKTMVIYTYHADDAADIHTRYPVSMKVWMLENKDGIYTAVRQEEFDDILQYSGSSIRVTGKKGIRMITSVEQVKKSSLTGNGLAGYTLKEYGTAIAWASQLSNDKPLVLGKYYTKFNYAYKRDVADPVFAIDGDLMQYTNVLVGFSDAQCKKDIAIRSYMILEDTEGNEITIYGGIVQRSIGYIAYQNRNSFKAGTEAYEYVWDIIRSVYGDTYDEEYTV